MSVAKRDNRSLNKIAYDILNRYVGGRSSSDNSISLEQIKFNIINARAMFLRQDMDKTEILNLHVEQNLGCVEMELVDEAECCGYNTGCYILRSKQKLPDPIRLKKRSAITFVGSVDGDNLYQGDSSYKSKWRHKGRFLTGEEVTHFFLDNYVYLRNALKLEVINVRMIPADPREAKRFKRCDGDPCYTDDSPFPVPDDMIPRIVQYVGESLMRPATQTLEDQETDLQDGNQTTKNS